jgi:hypothetical protein
LRLHTEEGLGLLVCPRGGIILQLQVELHCGWQHAQHKVQQASIQQVLLDQVCDLIRLSQERDTQLSSDLKLEGRRVHTQQQHTQLSMTSQG